MGKADNLTTILCLCHEIWETSWNPLGHSRPVTGLLYLNNWGHRNSNKEFKENFGNHSSKIFSRFTTENNYTRNITRKTESTAVWNLKPERWGSALVQEKYQEEKICYKRQQKYDDDDGDDDNDDNNNNNYYY